LIFQTIASELKLPVPPIERVSYDKTIPGDFGLDIRRANSYLDWFPSIDLKEGLKELILDKINQKIDRRLMREINNIDSCG